MRPDLEQENLYYRKALKHPTVGLIGRNYLETRGITEETIDKWEIGWSPVGCIPSNFDKSDEFKPWTKLWGRITFPIRSQSGEMASISGRQVIKIDNKPKYDHYAFSARKILFGLYQNKEDIQKEDRIIITEGQLDVISAWQNGLKIVASSFGAHCSLDHFAIISRYASVIDVIYDEDNAGWTGTQAVKDFSTWGDLIVNLRTGIFPAKEDLDSWIKTHSKKELFQLIEENDKKTFTKSVNNFVRNRRTS
jgi:DNA primase